MVKCILRCFGAVSGLRVNFAKIVIYGVREILHVELLARSLGLRECHLLVSYLGLPLGSYNMQKHILNPVVERVLQ